MVKTEVTQRISKDRKWFITKTIITDIKSMKYINLVLQEA